MIIYRCFGSHPSKYPNKSANRLEETRISKFFTRRFPILELRYLDEPWKQNTFVTWKEEATHFTVSALV